MQICLRGVVTWKRPSYSPWAPILCFPTIRRPPPFLHPTVASIQAFTLSLTLGYLALCNKELHPSQNSQFAQVLHFSLTPQTGKLANELNIAATTPVSGAVLQPCSWCRYMCLSSSHLLGAAGSRSLHHRLRLGEVHRHRQQEDRQPEPPSQHSTVQSLPFAQHCQSGSGHGEGLRLRLRLQDPCHRIPDPHGPGRRSGLCLPHGHPCDRRSVHHHGHRTSSRIHTLLRSHVHPRSRHHHHHHSRHSVRRRRRRRNRGHRHSRRRRRPCSHRVHHSRRPFHHGNHRHRHHGSRHRHLRWQIRSL
mmetsp:Transcript_43315/g.67852  ORF Transcript_43315/g.67852 Transcript_43315/m.67852 type:complete len:304 (-) Transcript_43315:1763-2674(-)